MSTAIVWFRRDLRLDDNPAWAAATEAHDEIVPVLVIEPALLDAAGPHRRRAFLTAAEALDRSIIELGGRLHVRIGEIWSNTEAVRAPSESRRQDAKPTAASRDAEAGGAA